MRILLIYDRIFPETLGGAERWYSELGERLAGDGHDVTYLTMRHWERGTPLASRRYRVVALGPRLDAYGDDRRRILPPLVFGAGALWHLLRRGRRYDVVHTASFPYFPLLAVALARLVHRFRVIVDWHEIWRLEYWREYLGGAAGTVGWLVQRACVAIPHRAFCFSRLYARRLVQEGFRGRVDVLEGEYTGELAPAPVEPTDPVVVFAGRHIPEKGVLELMDALAVARRSVPSLRAQVFGEGPLTDEIRRRAAEPDLGGAVAVRGFAPWEEVDAALRSAMCMALPSRREGYGLVVVEAAARSTPSVVIEAPDNAAVELIEDGVNGAVAPSAAAPDLAEAILRVHHAGPAMRQSTHDWFAAQAPRLSLDNSLETVVGSYTAV